MKRIANKNGRKIDIGHALIELKQTAADDQFEREAYRLFKIVHGAERRALVRVAGLYGQRPDIWRHVPWNSLAQLARKSTPSDLRQEFEARIKAGERITAKEIAARRATLLVAPICNESRPGTP